MSESNGYAGRDAFTKLQRRYTESPILGFGKVCIRSFTLKEKEDLQYSLMDERGEVDMAKATKGQRVRFIIAAVVDHNTHQPLFTEDDFDALETGLDPDVADALFDAILDHTHFNEDGIDALKKRYSDSRDSDSPTDSQTTGTSRG